MIRFPRAALVLTLLLALAPLGGCQETLRANVTRFSSLSTVPSGQSVMILPEGPQIGSLEFQHYAELVAAALGNLGFKPTANDAVHPADFVVILHYGQVGRKTIARFRQPQLLVAAATPLL